MEFFQIEVTQRESVGSRNAGRLRRAGSVPAVLCGMNKGSISLAIPEKELDRFLRSGSHLVELKMSGETRPAIIREVQIDPVTDHILHVDFHRVDADHELEDQVAIQFKGRPKGESEGGVAQVLKETILVRCRPRLLPEEFLVEIADLAVGDAVRVSDLETPEGVTLLEDENDVIIQVAIPKRVEEEAAAEDEVPAEGEVPGEAEGGGEPAPAE